MNNKMKHQRSLLLIFIMFFGFTAPELKCAPFYEEIESLSSPEPVNEVLFLLQDGVPYYSVINQGREIIKPSKLGFSFMGQEPFDHGFKIISTTYDTVDYKWTQPWGEVKEIRDYHHSMNILLGDDSDRYMRIIFRAYDDGIAFRYVIPEQNDLMAFEMMDELTEFNFTSNHSVWWIPAYFWNRYESLYRNTPLNEADTVHTPVTLETSDGLFLSIHEAALTDYSSMTLARARDNSLKCDLVPWSDAVKVRGELPLKTPWRTIQIAESAGDLITSYLVLNCNEPPKIDDVSWIKPGKYVGIWWGMHLGTSTWSSGDKHGATTGNTMKYIDFAARHGFEGVLVEGWNLGWDGDWIANSEKFDFLTPYPDYDLHGVCKYAADRGVKIIAHNETSTGILNYERQLVEAFKLYHELGINTIKSGYVGHRQEIKRRNPVTGAVLGQEWHHGQFMVNHYREVVETAAKNEIMLDVHEPIKDTGIRRTWPNMMTREGARGQEFNAWGQGGGNPPEHTTILPFTRLLGGPFDFTPGIFDLLFEQANRPDNRVNTTLVKQLALYVVIYSPLHMAADLPENYEGHPAFKFIEDVPTDWEDTIVLNGKIGDYITIVRKDRNSDDWYLGSITDENARSFDLPLSFLDAGRTYIAEIYADGKGADWEDNPLTYEISKIKVTSELILNVQIAPGGGQAVRFTPAER